MVPADREQVALHNLAASRAGHLVDKPAVDTVAVVVDCRAEDMEDSRLGREPEAARHKAFAVVLDNRLELVVPDSLQQQEQALDNPRLARDSRCRLEELDSRRRQAWAVVPVLLLPV